MERPTHATTVLASLLSLLSPLVGCSKADEDTKPSSAPVAPPVPGQGAASCDRITSMSVCSEYGAAQVASSVKILTAQCTKLGGAYVGSPCPNTAVLGACTMSTGEARIYYSSGGMAYDAARAEKDCGQTLRGKWKAFPW